MEPRPTVGRRPGVRSSGYVSWLQEIWYGKAHPFYDLITWWCFLPLGSEARCRREFARWLRLKPGQRVASLCCGTGKSEQAILEHAPGVKITGVDLGAGQIARARRNDRGGRIDYRIGDASSTGLEGRSFDRVVITLALHEMPRAARLAVLREAVRLCNPDGLVVAIDHADPGGFASRFLRAFWWLFWLPGNPELTTARDLQRRGMGNEMGEVGLEVVDRRETRLSWIEGIVARPGSVRSELPG